MQLVRHLHEPVAVFRSGLDSTNPKTGMVALTELEIGGKPVMIALHLGGARKDRMVVHKVASFYGKDSRLKFLGSVGELLAVDQTKTPAWFPKQALLPKGSRTSTGASSSGGTMTNGLQLPAVRGSAARTGTNVLTENDYVKPFSSGSGAYSRTAPTFYSALLEAIQRGKSVLKQGTAASWKGWLDGAVRRGEFRQAERDWLGLDGWLDGRGTTTREDVEAYINANQVQVQDVVLGADTNVALPDLPEGWTVEHIEGDRMPWTVYDDEGTPMGEGRSEREARLEAMDPDERADVGITVGDTRFGQYRLPGGQNYRELLLTLPQESMLSQEMKQWLDAGGYEPAPSTPNAWAGALENLLRIARTKERNGEHEQARKFRCMADEANRRSTLRGDAFRSGHFDQPNVLAHVRFNERTDADGKRVLFIEEIQSDWHQQGRKRGYGKKAFVVRPTGEGQWHEVVQPDGSVEGPFGSRASAEAWADGERASSRHNGVPDAPFKGTDEWAMLAFKRMVRWAAEHGFDRIAWTTGAQQAERYDLSKQVSRIDWTRTTPATGQKLVSIQMQDGLEFRVGKDGIIAAIGGDRTGDSFAGKRLDEVVGKEVADKILADDMHGSLSGDGLKVGSSGMRGFYDNILPKAVNKWAKRFGGRVGGTKIDADSAGFGVEQAGDVFRVRDRTSGTIVSTHPTAGEAFDAASALEAQPSIPVHAIDITPAMRDAALQGLPLFSQSGPRIQTDGRGQRSIDMGGETFVDRSGRFYLVNGTGQPKDFTTLGAAREAAQRTGGEVLQDDAMEGQRPTWSVVVPDVVAREASQRSPSLFSLAPADVLDDLDAVNSAAQADGVLARAKQMLIDMTPATVPGQLASSRTCWLTCMRPGTGWRSGRRKRRVGGLRMRDSQGISISENRIRHP